MRSFREQLLARLRSYLPVRIATWLDRQVSRRAIRRMNIPPEWLLEGPDGFRAEDEIDIVFGFAHPNPNRIGCCSEAELVELAHRRRSIDDPGYAHVGQCSPCYRRVRALQGMRSTESTRPPPARAGGCALKSGFSEFPRS
jgi:hypothetical protein